MAASESTIKPAGAESIFDEKGKDDFEKYLENAADENAESNVKFYEGEHWQDEEGWSGPPITKSDEQTAKDTMDNVEDYFVSSNKIAEVVDRHRDAIVGSELQWNFTLANPLPPVLNPETEEMEIPPPTEQEQALINELEQALTSWWDKRHLLETIQKAVVMMLLTKRAFIRLFVPTSQLEKTGEGFQVPSGTLQESVNRIYLEVVTDEANLYTDRRSQEQVSVLKYKDDDDKEIVEVSYLDGVGLTIVKVYEGGQEQANEPIDLAGNLTMHMMELPRAFISKQVTSLQKFLNFNLTMWQRNQAFAGFRERWLMNAEEPGEEKVDAATGRREFFPDVFRTGPGTVNVGYGISKGRNNMGGEDLLTPSLQILEPVSIDSFKATNTGLYNVILDETKQTHVKLNEANISGKSRIEAKADFRSSLGTTETRVISAARFILETVAHMAAVFSGQPGRFKTLRASASCKIDLGPFSPEEIEAGLKLVEAGIWSKEYFASLTGIDDFDSMLDRIRKENPDKTLQTEREQLNLEAERRTFQRNNPPEPPQPTGSGQGGQS